MCRELIIVMEYQKGSFVVIPNKKQLKGKPSEMQAIYYWICEHADENGICFPSRKTLAFEAGVNIKTVDKYIEQLELCGFLKKQIRKVEGKKENMSNLYQVMILDNGVVPKTALPSTKNGTTPSTKNGTVTITNINHNQLTNIAEASSADVPKVIKAFETINPASSKFYGNKTQRAACQFLIDTYGLDRTILVIEQTLPKTNGMKYFPTILSPVQLQDKWSSLESAIKKHRSENNNKGRGFAE